MKRTNPDSIDHHHHHLNQNQEQEQKQGLIEEEEEEEEEEEKQNERDRVANQKSKLNLTDHRDKPLKRNRSSTQKESPLEPPNSLSFSGHLQKTVSFNPIKIQSFITIVPQLNNKLPSSTGSIKSQQSSLEFKKIPIQNLKKTKAGHSENSPPQFHQDCLLKLKHVIDNILAVPPKPTDTSLTTLSDTCQTLVLAGTISCETLYHQTRTQLEDKTHKIRQQLMGGLPQDGIISSLLLADSVELTTAVNSLDPTRSQSWLKEIQAVWQEWFDQLILIRCILVHLDRFILAQSELMQPIWELGLDLFRQNVIGRPWNPISLSLSVVICHQVTLDRSGKSVPSNLVRLLAQLIFTTFGASGFTTFINSSLNQTTESFYSEEGKRLVNDLQAGLLTIGGPNGYLAHIQHRLDSETELCNKLFSTPDRELNARLLKTVIRLIETNLIRSHLEALLSNGLVQLLASYPDPSSAASLTTFYRLLTKLGEGPILQLRSVFSTWIRKTGSSMVEKASGGEEAEAKWDAGMIDRLLNFRTKLIKLMNDCFDEDREMFYAIKEAFETFINQRKNKPAELLAKYLDQKIRNGTRSMSETELEDCFDQVLVLFRYTQGKDLFEEFYKRDFSKRLLLSKSNSVDLERNMIMKLKKECGPGFTDKLEVMFRDIETSNDLKDAYEALKSASEPRTNELELSVSVLTAGVWPTSHSKESRVVLPNDLQVELERFEEFYTSKHLGRQLTWAHSLSQFVLSARFPSPSGHPIKKELSVSTHQGLILLLFNDLQNPSIDFESIVQQTGIDEKTAARTLQSLACGKVRVLVKQPKSKEVSKGDVFLINPNFKDDHFRIKINQIQAKESMEERTSTRDKVVTERSTWIQLLIVRIMKAKKSAKFNTLVHEVIDQSKERFKVEVKEIKAVIENLISRDYLERDGLNGFQYLA